MNLLVLVHSPAATGADTTIRRIAAHLTAVGHRLTLVGPDEAPTDPAGWSRLAAACRADLLIGTHALVSGQLFRGAGRPYVLILGGTDLNELTRDPEYFQLIADSIEDAAAVVVFNRDFADRCMALSPRTADRVHLIPPGVQTRPSRFSLRRQLGLDPAGQLLLLPSGLDPVADPLFLANCVQAWHAEDPRVELVIAGPGPDPDFRDAVCRRLDRVRGVRYTGALPQPDLHAAMLEATAVLNTSVSGCSPSSVLEAMHLGCPVVVRNVPGNTGVVEHGVTGLVFDDPLDFRRHAQRLVDDEQAGRRLGWRGQRFVRQTHGLRAERAGYAAVLRQVYERELPAGTGSAPS